eukprot:1828053-Rhodomonas_salina.2
MESILLPKCVVTFWTSWPVPLPLSALPVEMLVMRVLVIWSSSVHEVLRLLCLRAVHHVMSKVVCMFPAEGTDGIWVALVPVIAHDDCSCGEAEAPGLKEVPHSLFRQCLVLKYIAEHFTAVS